ncbi:MAG: HNH endonuclease signature motif containing protein [Bacilli bacterium]
MAKAKDFVVVKDYETILKIIEDKSDSLTNYIKESPNSKFVLYYKYLTHSDLPTLGKATKVNSLEDNLLYYLNIQEMRDVETRESRPFETAHQSNIGMQKDFWDDLGMKNPRETVGGDISEKIVNNYAKVLLVNDSLKYFKNNYTKKVFSKLGKSIKSRSRIEWTEEKLNMILKDGDFTPIELTQAVHGLGVATDIEFAKLRKNMFKNDQLFLLIEQQKLQKTLFIMPVKNPRFFTIIGETNEAWEQYQIKQNQIIDRMATQVIDVQQEIASRQYQDKWRNLLAEEMMNFTTKDREVFCPFTYISSNFDNIGTLYRASHIKGYSDCQESEKYDLNNGLLLVANADALFDKHLISVDENKSLMFSFLIMGDALLKQKLLLNQEIFKDVLNEERMRYLAIHRAIFLRKEQERKRN